jgi:hypothetical protein
MVHYKFDGGLVEDSEYRLGDCLMAVLFAAGLNSPGTNGMRVVPRFVGQAEPFRIPYGLIGPKRLRYGFSLKHTAYEI